MTVRRALVSVSGRLKEAPTGDTVAATALRAVPAAGDLSSPGDGDIWYNSSTNKFRKRENGATTDLDTSGAAPEPQLARSLMLMGA